MTSSSSLEPYILLQSEIALLVKSTNFLGLMTPINVNNFESEEIIDPKKFKYLDLGFDPAQSIKGLKELEVPEQDPFLYQIYTDLIKDYQLKCECLLNRGDGVQVMDLCCQIYGKPTDKLLKIANKILTQEIAVDQSQKRMLNSQEVTHLLRSYLKYFYSIDDWQIISVDNRRRASIITQQKILKLPTDETLKKYGTGFTIKKLKCLIAHEIDTHLICSTNAGAIPLHVFKNGSTGYLKTQEGLAQLAERKAGRTLDSLLYNPATYYITAMAAIEGESHIDIYSRLRDLGLSSKKANNAIFAIFRGGGLIKDHTYLEGWQLMKSALKESVKIEDFYRAKIRHDQIPEYLEFLKRYNLDQGEQIIPTIYRDTDGFHAFFDNYK